VDVQFRLKSCQMTAASDLIFRDREIIPCQLSTFVEVCKDEFDRFYSQASNVYLSPRPGTAGGPNDRLIALMQDRFVQSASRKLTPMIWTGGLNILPEPDEDECVGLITHLNDSRTPEGQDYIKVDCITGNLSCNNTVILEIRKMHDAFAANEALYQKSLQDGDVWLYVSSTTYRSLYQAFLSQVLQAAPTVIEMRGSQMYVFGLPVFSSWGIPANHALITHPRNLFVGIDLESDWTTFRFIDRSETDLLNQTIQFGGMFSIGTQYLFGEEIIYYNPLDAEECPGDPCNDPCYSPCTEPEPEPIP
jgi:hypothetical protein